MPDERNPELDRTFVTFFCGWPPTRTVRRDPRVRERRVPRPSRGVREPCARSRPLATFLGDGGDRIERQYHHGVALEAHPFLVFPDAQLLVDAFARHSDEVAEILLGDRNLALAHAGGIGIEET